MVIQWFVKNDDQWSWENEKTCTFLDKNPSIRVFEKKYLPIRLLYWQQCHATIFWRTFGSLWRGIGTHWVCLCSPALKYGWLANWLIHAFPFLQFAMRPNLMHRFQSDDRGAKLTSKYGTLPPSHVRSIMQHAAVVMVSFWAIFFATKKRHLWIVDIWSGISSEHTTEFKGFSK